MGRYYQKTEIGKRQDLTPLRPFDFFENIIFAHRVFTMPNVEVAGLRGFSRRSG